MDVIQHKPIMLAGLLLKNPVLWLATTLSGVVGAVLDHDPMAISPPLKVVLAVLAFFGAFIAQLLNFWLKSRQQRDKAAEENAARWERLYKEQRDAHEKEVARHLSRISDLEKRLDKEDRI